MRAGGTGSCRPPGSTRAFFRSRMWWWGVAFLRRGSRTRRTSARAPARASPCTTLPPTSPRGRGDLDRSLGAARPSRSLRGSTMARRPIATSCPCIPGSWDTKGKALPRRAGQRFASRHRASSIRAGSRRGARPRAAPCPFPQGATGGSPRRDHPPTRCAGARRAGSRAPPRRTTSSLVGRSCERIVGVGLAFSSVERDHCRSVEASARGPRM